MPPPVKPVPVVVTCEMVAVALPVLVMVTDCVPLLPTVTLPKFTLAGLAASCATVRALPLPPRCSPCGEFEALLVRVTSPLELPVDVGAKVTVNDALAPADKVNGVASPPTLYGGEALTLSCEIVALALPLFVMETDFVDVLPTVTSPKSRVVGLSAREAEGAGDEAVAVALTPTDMGELAALLVIVKVPERGPVACGATEIVSVAFWPGATLIGNEAPLTVKFPPATVA